MKAEVGHLVCVDTSIRTVWQLRWCFHHDVVCRSILVQIASAAAAAVYLIFNVLYHFYIYS